MKLKTPLLASVGALLLVSALFLSVVLSTAAYRPDEKEILMPTGATQVSKSEAIRGRNLKIAKQTEITADNIQQVILSLSRPENYAATVTSSLYYDGQPHEVWCHQAVKNGAYRVDYLSADGAVERTELIYDGSFYAWHGNNANYFSSTQGDFTADQSAMIPTYETVCALPRTQIAGGSLQQEGEEMLLVVDAWEDNRAMTYKISVHTGLLAAAILTQDDETIRSVKVEVDKAAPADGMFVLPGTMQPIFENAAQFAQN